MFSLNRAEIIGNLTRDPELRYTPNGQAVTSFAVATNRRWRDKDGNNQEQTEFHDVVAWGKSAEIVTQILKKGNKVYIEGRLQTRQWEGQDGGKRSRTEIIIENFVALTPKGETPDLGSDVQEFPINDEKEAAKPKKAVEKKEETPTSKTNDDEINLDDIPF